MPSVNYSSIKISNIGQWYYKSFNYTAGCIKLCKRGYCSPMGFLRELSKHTSQGEEKKTKH